MIRKVDKKNKYISVFDPNTGFYMRSGVIDKDGKDTNVDPFMSSYPELIDVGVMGNCIHGARGLCVQGGVQCYQNGLGIKQPNMSLENFQKIVDECEGKSFQLALGGRGDVNKHEDFEGIVSYCRSKNVVPNYTTSGLDLTEEETRITKQYCGAVAVSWYRQQHTLNAIQKYIDAGMKTNIHYVLGNNSIDEAIDRLTNKTFPTGINAIIFLLHKPVGLGQQSNVLQYGDERLNQFFKLIDTMKFDFKIGFDSCTVPAILNLTSNINKDSIDTCEGGRYSMYITSDMKGLPCSFDNQDLKFAYDLNNDTIQNAWDSKQFDDFRSRFHNSCSGCKDKISCQGGCPLQRSIVLCDREEKELYEV